MATGLHSPYSMSVSQQLFIMHERLSFFRLLNTQAFTVLPHRITGLKQGLNVELVAPRRMDLTAKQYPTVGGSYSSAWRVSAF